MSKLEPLPRPGRKPNQKPAARGWPSRIAIELALLDDPLVRLGGALDAVLPIIAFAGEDLRDLVDAARPAAAIGPGGVKDGLADLELVIAQVILRVAEKTRGLPRPAERPFLWDS